MYCYVLVVFSPIKGFPGGSESKESTFNARDLGSIHESGRSPGGGNGNPLQYSCLENSMDRGAWQVIVRGIAKTNLNKEENSLMVQWLRLHAPNAGDLGSIPVGEVDPTCHN